MREHIILPLCTALAVCIQLPSAHADLVGRTTVSFSPLDVDVDTFDSLVLDWTTPVMSGLIDESDLSSLTFSLLNGTTLVYQDAAIIDGVEQPIGGEARTTGDIEFHFNIDTLMLIDGPGNERAWDNDRTVVQSGGSGVTWNIYASPAETSAEARFDKYLDGRALDDTSTIYSQSTTIVPEPSPLLYLLIAAMTGVGSRNSRRLASGSLS